MPPGPKSKTQTETILQQIKDFKNGPHKKKNLKERKCIIRQWTESGFVTNLVLNPVHLKRKKIKDGSLSFI